VFSALQIFSSGFVAFTHGMNDAQKAMGIITLALFSGKMIQTFDVPFWVILLCAVMMGLGTIHGGWKVIKTLGMRLAHIRPTEGFASGTAAGIVLTTATHFGMPVSTTHTVTGSITGVGAAYHIKSVKWAIGAKIISAWILTLPVCAMLGAVLSLLINRFQK
jgi:inorganic phosphate transporter, PiT family